MRRKAKNIIALVALSAICAACDPSETDEEKKQRDKAADTDQTPLASCGTDEIKKLRVDYVSWSDESVICTTIQRAMGHYPSVSLARRMSQIFFIMHANRNTDDPKDIAYQIMGIIEVRNQMDNPKDIDGTLETITKIFNGTDGHVTPKDLNIELHQADQLARTLSDEGLMNMAAVIWEMKKSRGE